MMMTYSTHALTQGSGDISDIPRNPHFTKNLPMRKTADIWGDRYAQIAWYSLLDHLRHKPLRLNIT
jgi:hypothetical protein